MCLLLCVCFYMHAYVCVCVPSVSGQGLSCPSQAALWVLCIRRLKPLTVDANLEPSCGLAAIMPT